MHEIHKGQNVIPAKAGIQKNYCNLRIALDPSRQCGTGMTSRIKTSCTLCLL